MTLRHYSYCVDIDVQEYVRVEESSRERVATFDRDRMERALSGPSFQIPNGLTPNEIRDFILRTASPTEK